MRGNSGADGRCLDDALAQAYLDRLVAELRKRGLRVAATLPALTVEDPAISGPQGQQVLLRSCECHGFTWCLVRPGRQPALLGKPTSPEVELMCPAEEIHAAADRINRLCTPNSP